MIATAPVERRSASSAWARAVSLVLAFPISAVLLLYPYALGTRIGPLTHTALPLVLLGVSGAFVHGFGYRPATLLPRLLFAPLTAWLLIGAGAALLLLA